MYDGKPVLVYYDGVGLGHYSGKWHVLDSSYRELATIDAGKGTPSDLHDIALRSDGTAIVESYVSVPTDLSASG
ncbi:MAG: arylsulfotransferase family protein [Nakamurella sp.]